MFARADGLRRGLVTGRLAALRSDLTRVSDGDTREILIGERILRVIGYFVANCSKQATSKDS